MDKKGYLEEQQKMEFKRVYDRVPGWIFNCLNDEAWTMTRTNSRIENILGYTEEEFAQELHNSISAVIPEPYRSQVRQYTTQTMARGYGAMHSYVTPVVRKDGRYCWLNVELYCDDDENEGLWYVSCADITDMKQTYDEELSYQDVVSDEDVLLKTRANITKDVVESIYTTHSFTLPDQSRSFTGGVTQLASRAYDEAEKKKLQEQLSERRMRQSLEQDGNYSFEYKRRDEKNHPSWAQVYVRAFLHPESQDLIAFVYLKDINDERKVSNILTRVSTISKETLALIYLDSDEIEFIKRYDEFSEVHLDDSLPYSANIELFANHYLREELREEAKRTFSIDSIRQHLEQEDVYECIYEIGQNQDQYKRWEYAYFDKENGIVIYKRTDVTETIRRQEEQNQRLKTALKETRLIKQEKEDEYNRFMSYICTAQDGVEELNIQEHTITRYFIRDHKLQKQTVSYPGMPFELFHEEDRQKAHDLYDEDKLAVLCQTEAVSYAELRMKWNNAAEYHWCNVIVLGMPVTRKTPFNVLVLIKDTNELKKKEVQQKRALEDAFKLAEQGSKAKGSFLSNMSHEIRTPLNAIIGYLTIASEDDCTAEKKDYCIENCQTASRHLLQIINDVLDMSSIENGKLKIAHEEFDLKKEIADITTIFYQNSRIKNVHFETYVENVTEEWVVGDQLRLNQVLMNLLSNAVKFTPEDGKVLLKIEQLRKDSQKVYMKFTVKDTGVGMSKEYMSRIFRPFEQENAGTAKKFGGSGLGLSITNNLVQMMGGKIDVQSEQDQGTIFEVTLFFDLSTAKHECTGQEDYSKIRALVVDDQVDEGSYVKRMLKRCGVKADTVTDGSAAFRKIRSRKGGDYAYDLCIIDWNMPEMDGCEVTRKIRSELGEEMPIIIATAYDISQFEEEARQAGANKIVSKPLFQSTLFDILVTSFGAYDPEAGRASQSPMNLSGIHLLLAEDNPMNMDIAVTILEKAGVKVDQAHDGKEAVDCYLASEPGTYDVILMDVQMPVVDGYEATAMIRESSHPEAKTIPIVAMTANAFAEDVAEALSKGMNAHIAKPISYDKLFAILKKFHRQS